jgi:hypothetical protein
VGKRRVQELTRIHVFVPLVVRVARIEITYRVCHRAVGFPFIPIVQTQSRKNSWLWGSTTGLFPDYNERDTVSHEIEDAIVQTA